MESLAVATAVIQFIEFTSKLVTKGIAIHSSTTGLTVDHEELSTISKSLTHSSDEIQESLSNNYAGKQLTQNERDLEEIAAGCQRVAKELLDVLASLELNGAKTKWRSFRHAIRASWNENKVQSLEARLERFRQQIMVNVLHALRQESRDLIREQSLVRASVERIEELQRNTIPVGDRFVRQVMDGSQWRHDLIQMIYNQGRSEDWNIANLDSLRHGDKEEVPIAVVMREKQIRARVLHTLAFRNMADRERRISKAYERTFAWIFSDPTPESRPWSSFRDFLVHPNKNIYWITGKPGSGKSTLMKYIRQHRQTTALLKTWGGNDDLEVIRAAFYFWNSGSRMQTSVSGLLQTVLHGCLQQLPQFVQETLPERWETASLFAVDDFPWTLEEVAQALRRLITEICADKKFFFMIDGLDECSGNHVQLVELISDLAEDAPNLKLCVASRPWNNFEDAFRGRPSLMLQDLSATDIEHYITSKFAANKGFAEFQVRDPSSAKVLLGTISQKAEGVFLWVNLVVKSLLEGLTNGEGLQDLHRRLKELPPNLEDLYANILENLDCQYLTHASKLFQVVRACDDSPTLLTIGLADLEDGNWAMQAPTKPMSTREKSVLCKNMKRKLSYRCRGLLDIASPVVQKEDDTIIDRPQGVETDDDKVWDASIADLEIQYLHRSVRDYIQSPGVWSWLVSATERTFDPNLFLFKANILQLKSLSPTGLTAKKMGFHVWMAVKYAKRSLNIHERTKEDHVGEVISLLNQVDKAATVLTSSPLRQGSTFVDRTGTLNGQHWSSLFLIRVPDPSFLHVMAVCGIHQYLDVSLSNPDQDKKKKANEDDVHDTNTGGRKKMPLMIAALQGTLLVPEMSGYSDLFGPRFGPHLMVFKVLLRKGWSCHKPYKGRSAWDLAEESRYAQILELFEEYKGKPPQTLPRQGNSPKSDETDGKHESDIESNTSTDAVAGFEPGPQGGRDLDYHIDRDLGEISELGMRKYSLPSVLLPEAASASTPPSRVGWQKTCEQPPREQIYLSTSHPTFSENIPPCMPSASREPRYESSRGTYRFSSPPVHTTSHRCYYPPPPSFYDNSRLPNSDIDEEFGYQYYHPYHAYDSDNSTSRQLTRYWGDKPSNNRPRPLSANYSRLLRWDDVRSYPSYRGDWIPVRSARRRRGYKDPYESKDSS